jgi:hypothetical protein
MMGCVDFTDMAVNREQWRAQLLSEQTTEWCEGSTVQLTLHT